MNLAKKILTNFKNQPDIWFFFGFLLTFTLSIRKVLFHFPIKENFNEYSGIYIYLSDIFLILTFIFWFISILCNNLLSLSRIRLWITRVLHNLYIILPLFLVFLSFLSILWSGNKSIAIFRSIKLLEFYLLYIYIIFRIVPRGTIFTSPNPSPYKGEGGSEHSLPLHNQNVPRGTLNNLFLIIILSGLIQAIIGIIQFFLQKSIGLLWLRESLISPDILGVAKIVLNGETYIRAYGLMPHPNVLGGFLLFSIIITLLYNKLFHVEQFKILQIEKSNQDITDNVPRGTLSEENIHSISNCSTWNNWKIRNNWSFRLTIAVQILALILTFSKSAIIGLLITLIFIIVPRPPAGEADRTKYTSPNPSPYKGEGGSEDSTSTQVQIVPRGTIQHLKLIVLSGFIILTSVFIIIKPNINSLFLNSLNERLFYLNVPRGTFESDPVFGLGAGQSALSMQKYFPQKLEFWQYQPVHNVFLLIFSELGLIGLGLFIWWLWKLFYPVNSDNVPRGTLSEHGAGSEQKEKNLTPFSLIRKRAGDEVDMEQEYNDYILHNDNTYLSSTIFSRYFQGILLGLIFIMLFDHYLWDIQQGSLLFWLTAGFITGIRTMHNKKSA
ncbi:MAG: hypothetical protein US30_C0012G0051 [Candidatus Moranbacteria bacterium GW2011_GWF2_36_839]|nr:MAG: hypothetical protein US27_C0012G0025 [Candidatus Moranbacteria bacterium GW2011_GWF1_36_78]KKQ16741.1 MAG: hypothetical protein US30_C0012G0051 [Candidatus Moranbacteria bacterium GW2011_GWF2_36_839]HAT74254.1 hypothetical protein [Candidatus Moranbacteria bacterium]HBY11378.1 hypothetical protein [Candidatus Moranbacteria bacterium]